MVPTFHCVELQVAVLAYPIPHTWMLMLFWMMMGTAMLMFQEFQVAIISREGSSIAAWASRMSNVIMRFSLSRTLAGSGEPARVRRDRLDSRALVAYW
jgi:hypothetical protein